VYTISKMFAFEASHVLHGLPEGHKCGRLPSHGHSYRVEVTLESEELNDVGFVVDYGELKQFGDYIDNEIDHHFLNDLFDFQTSAENLAKHFYEWCVEKWPQVRSVRVSETQKTWAEYKPYVSVTVDLDDLIRNLYESTEIPEGVKVESGENSAADGDVKRVMDSIEDVPLDREPGEE